MRKHLKVEKRKLFSYTYINEKHKKVNRIIRISFTIILLIISFYEYRNINQVSWYFEFRFVFLMFLAVSEMFRAFMEWKYSENRKEYIFTISQLIFLLVLLGVLFTSDPFGLFTFKEDLNTYPFVFKNIN